MSERLYEIGLQSLCPDDYKGVACCHDECLGSEILCMKAALAIFRACQEDMKRRAEARVFAAAMEVGLDGDTETAALLTVVQSAIASLEVRDEPAPPPEPAG